MSRPDLDIKESNTMKVKSSSNYLTLHRGDIATMEQQYDVSYIVLYGHTSNYLTLHRSYISTWAISLDSPLQSHHVFATTWNFHNSVPSSHNIFKKVVPWVFSRVVYFFNTYKQLYIYSLSERATVHLFKKKRFLFSVFIEIIRCFRSLLILIL